MVHINVAIPDVTHKKLKIQAFKHNITMKDHIITILNNHR